MNRVANLVSTAVGVLLCFAIAVLIAAFAHVQPGQLFIPFAFVGLVFLLALRYGKAVGVLGTVVGALVFAYLLYPPLHSFQVAEEAGRRSLAWMLLLGLVVSHLLLPPKKKTR